MSRIDSLARKIDFKTAIDSQLHIIVEWIVAGKLIQQFLVKMKEYHADVKVTLMTTLTTLRTMSALQNSIDGARHRSI